MSYSRIPLNGMFRITNEFGVENPRYKCGFHTGVDLVNDDRIIYSPAFGKVYNIGYDASYGNYIDIIEDDGFHHWLCHLYEVECSIGDQVKPTDRLGIMGGSGNVTGVHLHYEIRNPSNKYSDVVDPCDYMMIPNEVGTYNEADYSIFGNEMKTLKRSTNLRNAPTINSTEKTTYLPNTTLFILEKDVMNNDGYTWDKVKIRINGKIGYMINSNYKE